jgi:ubiquitin C-terminal hydrolase
MLLVLKTESVKFNDTIQDELSDGVQQNNKSSTTLNELKDQQINIRKSLSVSLLDELETAKGLTASSPNTTLNDSDIGL